MELALRADIAGEMTRAIELPLLLVAVAVGGYLFVNQVVVKSTPSAPALTQMETRADAAVAGANFASAAPALQAWYAQNATYAGATVPPGTGVALVRADSNGYCLQADVGGTAEHEVGPNGQPQPGPC